MQKRFIKINELAWEKSRLHLISGDAFRSWIFLICFSSTCKRDGVVTSTAFRCCQIPDVDRDELLSAGFLEVIAEDEWRIVKYEEWQTTSESAARAGRRGADIRWNGKPVAGGDTSEDQDGAPKFNMEVWQDYLNVSYQRNGLVPPPPTEVCKLYKKANERNFKQVAARLVEAEKAKTN